MSKGRARAVEKKMLERAFVDVEIRDFCRQLNKAKTCHGDSEPNSFL